MIRVGLIGPADREEIQRLAMRLEERSIEPVIIDTSGPTPLSIDGDRIEACGIELSGMRGLYVGDLGLPPTRVTREDGSLDLERSAVALQESQAVLATWNVVLERLGRQMVVINPPATYELHGLKPFEIAVYRDAGWPVPETVSTNDPETLTALDGESRSWIRKGLLGGYSYTENFEPPADPAAAVAALSGGSLMVQERIEGNAVRAFVLGGKFRVAAEIINRDPGEVDSRRGPIRVRPVELPDDVAETVVRVAAEWGMRFAAVDLMRDERTDAWTLLECNSSPFFVEFERATGHDLSSALADALLGR